MLRAAFHLVFCLTLLIAGVSIGATQARAEKRVALVIGNSAYEHAAPLANARNDAEAFAGVLEGLGFEVVKGVDLTYTGMRRALRDFAYKLEGADAALFFYAGHGLQVKGGNYLVPRDARLDKEIDLDFEAVRLRTVLEQMERSAKTNLVFLDACRDNPLARNLARSMGTRSAAVGRGLARVESGVGTMIAFATQPGNVALDGQGKNSPFTSALVKHVATPGLDVALVMRRVREDVIAETNGAQVPWDNSSLTGTFTFRDMPKEEPKPAPVAGRHPMMPAVDNTAIELAFWQAAKDAGTKAAYEAYLAKFPKGNFAPLVAIKLDELAQTQAAEAKRQAELEAAQKKQTEAEKSKRKAEAEKRQRELVELEKKQEEERARLAKERDELAQRLKALEERAKQRAEAEKTKEQKLAALTPQADPAPVSALDPFTMTMVLQNELKRVGCDPGTVDGKWGGKGRSALAQFNIYAKLSLSTEEPSMDAIDAVRTRKERVCPLVCGPRHDMVGDQCVLKSCGGGQELDARGQCVRVAAKKPEASRATTADPAAKKSIYTGATAQCIEQFGYAICRGRQ